ncbi:MAG: DUF2520 domain-containing protein [Candidatus Aminicenantes bacterium]|nr:DUF2520 domain-containing protein [Candidatus Aminicenantes bacterium]
MKTFSIIGAGRVGIPLAAALTRKGFVLKKISDCSLLKARRAKKIIGQGRATTDNRLAANSAEIIFICVPDSQIVRIAEEISSIDYQGKFVFHTSGAFSSKLLEPLAQKGAAIASFHPIQTFATEDFDPKIFKGIFFGLEGDSKAIKLGINLARKLGGQALLISAENKPVYHLACSISSNFLIVLLTEVKQLLRTIGLEEELSLEILTPLLNKTLHNVKKFGIEQSLTGPVVRGDLETVKQHLAITATSSGLDRIYRAMALEALRIAEKRGLPEEKIKSLKQLLEYK